jgi:hypothetical protein
MTTSHHRETLDDLGAASPTTRQSGVVMSVDRGRLRAALETLAKGVRGHQAETLLGFVCLMMSRGSGSPTGYEGWLDGSLVVLVRPRGPRGVSVHVAADSGEGYQEAFAVPFARLPFASVCAAIEQDPAIVGPAFVHVDDAELTILVVTYVEAEVESSFLDYDEPERTVTDLDVVRRARAAVPPPPGEVESSSHDPEATLIVSPSSELLQLSRALAGDATLLLGRRLR